MTVKSLDAYWEGIAKVLLTDFKHHRTEELRCEKEMNFHRKEARKITPARIAQKLETTYRVITLIQEKNGLRLK